MTGRASEAEHAGEAPRPTSVKPNQFLPKKTYRARRLEDALKLWPLLGGGLFFLPVLWISGVHSNVSAMVFLFVLWGLLLIGAAALSQAYGDAHAQDGEADQQPDTKPETGADTGFGA